MLRNAIHRAVRPSTNLANLITLYKDAVSSRHHIIRLWHTHARQPAGIRHARQPACASAMPPQSP